MRSGSSAVRTILKHEGGNAPDGRKVKATLHWVSANHALQAEVRLYSHLFARENPARCGRRRKILPLILTRNPWRCFPTAMVEPSLKNAEPESIYQFERLGYFCADRYDCTKENLCSTGASPSGTPGRESRKNIRRCNSATSLMSAISYQDITYTSSQR